MDGVRDQSILLSRTLDALELSNDHIRSKISKFSRLEVLANVVDYQPDFQNTILTGSVMDGVCWKGYMTDIDTMHRFQYVTVVDRGHKPRCAEHHHVFELVDENVHPGYTKLKLTRESAFMENNIFSLTPNGAKSYCYEIDGNFYLSSHKFKSGFNRYQVIPERPPWVMQSSYNYAVTFPDDEEILEHGPSLCFSDDTKEEPLHDSVPCFHCNEWPTQASNWKHRTPRFWPSKDDVDNAIADGCDVVAVGFVGSQSRHLEWRLSFALTEQKLLRNFNNTQHKCYSLLKMLLKEAVDEKVPNVLSSFQMKNALLWTLEKTDPNIWHDTRITEAFMACVTTMYTFIKDGIAPSYFIPENNVLDRRMGKTDQTQLIKLFEEFLKEDWKCLLRCKSLTGTPNLQKLVDLYIKTENIDCVLQELSKIDVKSIWFQHDIELFPRYEDARLEIMTSVAPKPESLSMAISRHHTVLEKIANRSVNKFYRETLQPIVAAIESSLGSHLFTFYKKNIDSSTSPNCLQNILTQAEHFLTKGTKSDASSGQLKFASYCYMIGDLERCRTIVDIVLQNSHQLSTFNPYFLPSKFGPTDEELKNYEVFVRETDMTMEQRFLSSAAHGVLFLPTEEHACPPAVKFQLQTLLTGPLEYTSWLAWAIYDPIVFAYYLRFLCELKDENVSNYEHTLMSIETLISEKRIGYEVSALNLLGFSYISVNIVEKGVPFLLEAMQKSIIPNTTVWQMGRTMSDFLNGPLAASK